MKNKRILIVALLAILLAGGGFLIASNSAERRSIKSSIVADTRGDPIAQVSLNANAASPDTVTVLAGRTVQFNSADGKFHDIAQGEGNAAGHSHDHEQGGIESGKFGANEGWRVQFKKAGNYFFHDHLNPNISVLVVVYEHKA